MIKERVLTPESFEALLSWLAQEREKAGEKYEAIRHRLILFFTGRGCLEADELADETITRVAIKLPNLINGYQGEPTYYFYGVARNVYQEHLRRVPRVTKLQPAPLGWSELEYVCMEKCMEKLSLDNRQMFEEYHCGEASGKMESRQRLAERLGIALNALRIRVYRVRATLKLCIEECLAREGE
jgi:DNA-directed RNA polymerase specialized sigma24 family protein